jgi:acyl carrier protein
METAQKVRNFIVQNLADLEEERELDAEDDIFELGFVDSMFALQLVAFIEEKFNIELDDEDLDIVNFRSVRSIEEFIELKTNA